MTEEQTPTGVQDPAPAPTPVPVAAPPAPVNPGPWSNDLAQAFQDEAVRGQVDAFLREKVQPHTTRLEQQAAEARDAQRLLTDLQNDPNATMEALAAELNWTPQQLQEAVEQQVEAPQYAQLDPEAQAALDYVRQEQAEKAYDAELARVNQQHPGIIPDVFHPLVVAADGDFDVAYQMYENVIHQFNAASAPPAEPGQPAPPTLGGDTGSTTPPVEPKQMTIAEAVDAMMAEARTTDPPPIS